ncbi:MAG: NAD-dependent epimerase/dehydratase family protein [Burkholderiales bacterium]
MRVLVTGGAGFIGSHVVERLLANGVAARVLDNLSTGNRENLPASHPGLEMILGDIRDSAAVDRATEGADAVIHLAAVASVQASMEDPFGTHQTNFDGTLNLLVHARGHGVRRFLYASSAAIYGDTTALPVAEDELPRPLSPYAADKLAGEHYLRYFVSKRGLNATAFRFFNIFGPRQDPGSPYSGVISIFADRAKTGRGVTIFGDGRQTRDFVFVGDLADILVGALDRDGLAGEVMNVGTGHECSLLDLLAALESLSGRRIEREHAPPRIGDIVRSCADVSRLRARFGSVPQTSVRDGLRELLRHSGLLVA